jgi:hypothetical protein
MQNVMHDFKNFERPDKIDGVKVPFPTYLVAFNY